jgi:hypothetical protein
MQKRTAISSLLLMISVNAFCQIWSDAPRELPEDLKTETILFLKFDSVEISPNAISGYRKKWSYHNDHVEEANKKLRKLASQYPYKYKIVSMTDTSAYRSYGAKYVLWLNSFDIFTSFGSYKRSSLHYSNGQYSGGDAPQVELGIYDLTSRKQYFITDKISSAQTYHYERFLPKFYKQVEKQFGESGK